MYDKNWGNGYGIQGNNLKDQTIRRIHQGQE